MGSAEWVDGWTQGKSFSDVLLENKTIRMISSHKMASKAENVSIWWRHHDMIDMILKYQSKCRAGTRNHGANRINVNN